jgi:hypothetical protein
MSGDFFSFLMEKNLVWNMSLTFCVLTIALLPPLVYSFIWFDKYSSDNKRTFINMLNTSLCWLCCEYFLVVQVTEVIRFVVGPLPKFFCFSKTIIRSAYITQALLYFDFIAITRYLFIFWLKNPAVFQDDFWYLFLNIWIKVASFLFNFAWFYTAEHQIINYYICTGIDPTEDFKKPLKLYNVVELGTVIVNVLIFLRVNIYRHFPMKQIIPQSVLGKHSLFSDFKKQSLASVSTNIVNLVNLAVPIMLVGKLSGIKPDDLHIYQNIIVITYLVSPGLFGLVFVLIWADLENNNY